MARAPQNTYPDDSQVLQFSYPTGSSTITPISSAQARFTSQPSAYLDSRSSQQQTRSESQLYGELLNMSFAAGQQVTSRASLGPGSIDDRHYVFEIPQQPQRARMCGFGDKDRRPLTPPPILKLLVYDRNGNLLNPAEIDTSFFVVLCDLWASDGSREVNLVVHPSTGSANQSTSLEEGATSGLTATRNLIGTLATSAVRLVNDVGELGIYFVFQDLSVRTEGTFKLRFSFVNVGLPSMSTINTEGTRVMAAAMTDTFQVFSAKKFPGMIESTPLSKAFAKQGIKIPIRKDGGKGEYSGEGRGRGDDGIREREEGDH